MSVGESNLTIMYKNELGHEKQIITQELKRPNIPRDQVSILMIQVKERIRKTNELT